MEQKINQIQALSDVGEPIVNSDGFEDFEALVDAGTETTVLDQIIADIGRVAEIEVENMQRRTAVIHQIRSLATSETSTDPQQFLRDIGAARNISPEAKEEVNLILSKAIARVNQK